MALEEARGPVFMTCGHVLDVLDARDPEALVRSWMDGAPVRRHGFGLPTRMCTWREGGENCTRPVRAVNAKFCEVHAAASKRRSNRQTWHSRTRKSNPSLALGNPRLADGEDPRFDPGIGPVTLTPKIPVS